MSYKDDINKLTSVGGGNIDNETKSRLKDYVSKGYVSKEDIDSLANSGINVSSDLVKRVISGESKMQKNQSPLSDYPRKEIVEDTESAIFPRTSKLEEVGPSKQRSASVGFDLLSLPGRTTMAVPRTVRELVVDSYNTNPEKGYLENLREVLSTVPSKFSDNLAMTETPSEKGFVKTAINVGEDIARHPATIIPGPGRIGGAIAKFAPELTLAARETVPAIVQGLGRVGAEGATQIGIGEVQRASTGEESSVGDILLEGTVGSATGLIPGLRSWGRGKADRTVGDIITQHKNLMGGELRGFSSDVGPIQNAEEMKGMLKEVMGGFYKPELSLTQNLNVYKMLAEKNPLFAKDKDYAKPIIDVIENGLKDTRQTLGIGDLIVSKLPIVGPAYIGGKTAEHASTVLSSLKNDPSKSSLVRGAGASLLQDLSRPAQDKVVQTQAQLDTLYNRSKSLGNGLLGR